MLVGVSAFTLAPTPAPALAAAPYYPCGPAPPDRESIHITGWS